MEQELSIEKQAERLLLDNYDKYYRLAFSYMKNEEDALDVVQESAYKVMKGCRNVKQPEYLGSWIYRIVINTSLDFLRKQKHETVTEEMPDIGVEDYYQDWDLRDILNRLSEQERTIIILRYFEEEKLEDIARIVGENINTVKTRLYRTLKKMKMELEAEAVFERGRMA